MPEFFKLKTDNLVAVLQDTWLDRVSAQTGSLDVSTPWVDEKARLICSVAAHATIWANLSLRDGEGRGVGGVGRDMALIQSSPRQFWIANPHYIHLFTTLNYLQ